MRLGAFLLDEPIPQLHAPHALVALRPWVDVGNVGTLVLFHLEARLKAKQLGRLAMPGRFFDFTRYRPTIYFERGKRQLSIPNVSVAYARREEASDLVFLRLLEPHMLGELYADSILKLLQELGVKRYCLLGSMYDLVPYARPLPVSGVASSKEAEQLLRGAGVQPSNYQGPTTILYQVSQQAPRLDIETMTVMVHLPQYAQLEEDHVGTLRLLEIFNSLYGLPVEPADRERAESQTRQVGQAVDRDPQLKAVVSQIEVDYDAQAMKKQEMPPLSPEIEKFLGEMDERFKED